MNCRHCKKPLVHDFVNLGSAPPSNAYLTTDMLSKPEIWYPLRVKYCDQCWLVQTEDFAERETFFNDDYAYFSSISQSWLDHAQNYSAAMTKRFGISTSSMVVEIASNDGYLLKNFQSCGVPCLGVEPTLACAEAAQAIGIETVVEFFGVDLAQKLKDSGYSADLMAANNVLAHVPDINDFVSGFSYLLKDQGVATFEFPHLLNLVSNNQFDTIYHEHYSYLSLGAVDRIFQANGLSIFEVEQIGTHGGSLRVYAQRSDTGRHTNTSMPGDILAQEEQSGISTHGFYDGFQQKAESIKDEFVEFLLEAKAAKKKVAAYGAAAKGNTLINFAGIRPDLVSFVADRNSHKVGRFMPGSRIPIVSEEKIRQEKPDYVVILPWNLKDEISSQLDYVRHWGGEFVVAVPELRLF